MAEDLSPWEGGRYFPLPYLSPILCLPFHFHFMSLRYLVFVHLYIAEITIWRLQTRSGMLPQRQLRIII